MFKAIPKMFKKSVVLFHRREKAKFVFINKNEEEIFFSFFFRQSSFQYFLNVHVFLSLTLSFEKISCFSGFLSGHQHQ